MFTHPWHNLVRQVWPIVKVQPLIPVSSEIIGDCRAFFWYVNAISWSVWSWHSVVAEGSYDSLLVKTKTEYCTSKLNNGRLKTKMWIKIFIVTNYKHNTISTWHICVYHKWDTTLYEPLLLVKDTELYGVLCESRRYRTIWGPFY